MKVAADKETGAVTITVDQLTAADLWFLTLEDRNKEYPVLGSKNAKKLEKKLDKALGRIGI